MVGLSDSPSWVLNHGSTPTSWRALPRTGNRRSQRHQPSERERCSVEGRSRRRLTMADGWVTAIALGDAKSHVAIAVAAGDLIVDSGPQQPADKEQRSM